MSVEEHPNYTAEQPLARLKEGSDRFVNGQARFPTVQKEVLADLANGQQPSPVSWCCCSMSEQGGAFSD